MHFEHFSIDLEQRRLLIQQQDVPLGTRAFDVLVALAAKPNTTLSKHTLMDIVWPDLVVEENNLQVQVSTLRKLLGVKTITTIPGRGYCLAAMPKQKSPDDVNLDVQLTASPLTVLPPLPPEPEKLMGNVPSIASKMMGRETDLQAIGALIKQNRLVTISGTGGIGKTHLAKHVSAQQQSDWPDGVWWLDAVTVADENGLLSLLAQHLRIELTGKDQALKSVTSALRPLCLLLVVDNCEHILSVAKQFVAELLNDAPSIHVLTTSQVRLQLTHEYVYQLGTLALPRASVQLEQAAEFGSIALFVARVQQVDRHFSLTPEALPCVVDICTQLDGVALSIELAAARVPLLGLKGVQERLGERLRLLSLSTASHHNTERHQSIRATLDWTYQLLSPEQAALFQRLSVLVGSFSLDVARHFLCDEHLDEWQMMALLEQLIDRSLIVVEGEYAHTPRYRILETHRLYAQERLQETGQMEAVQQRFASAAASLCRQLVKERATQKLWDEMNHIRAAFQWAAQQSDEVNQLSAITLAVSSAMLLAVSGFAYEALQRLLQVKKWVGQTTPVAIAARYWQWLGRCGVQGRLATSQCVEAFATAEKLFQSLSDWRHVHACRRMRGEALLDNNEFEQANIALLEAQAMEYVDWPLTDRMRRIKVQALLAAQTGKYDTAQRLAEQALSLAERASVERYIWAIRLDIANLKLQSGAIEEALDLFLDVTDQTVQRHYHHFTAAQALLGLMMALLQQGKLKQATQVCQDGLPRWRSSGLLLKYGDVIAHWLVLAQHPKMAVTWLGAANAFNRANEVKRNKLATQTHDRVLALLRQYIPDSQLQTWLAQSDVNANEAHADETLLTQELEILLKAHLAAQ